MNRTEGAGVLRTKAPAATRDIVFPAVPLRLATVQNQAQAPYAAWAALCQDPDPSLTLSPPCAYAEVPWNPSAGLRNGVYDLTSAVTVTGSDGVTRTWTSPPFTVDHEDLLITSTVPVNPTPLLWDPDKLNPATGAPDALPLSAAFHATCKATVTATVRVYTSDQVLVRTLTKALLTTDGTTDAGGTVLWDGRGEPVNGQPGARQPRGVYLFQWTLTDSLGVTDCDKSASLSITQTKSDLTGDYDPATDRNTTKDGCVLTDSATPRADASAATVQVYAGDTADMAAIDGFVPWTQTVAPTPLPSLTTNAPGASPPVWDEITFPEVIQMQEVHLFCAQDSHAAADRGGRNRWALQKNQAPKHPRTDNYDAIQIPGGVDKLAANWQKWVRYGAHADGSPTSLSTLMNRLPYDRLMHCVAPGAGEQRTDYYGGIEIPDSTNSEEHQRLFFQKPSSYLDGFYVPAKGFSFFNVRWPDTSHSGEAAPKPFSYLLLAVWEGCVTGVSSTDNLHPEYHFGNLVDGTVAYGAKCSVGFTGFITISGTTDNVWATSFWQALTVGEQNNHSPDTVVAAITWANQQVKLGNQGNFNGYDSCRWAGDATVKIAPVH